NGHGELRGGNRALTAEVSFDAIERRADESGRCVADIVPFVQAFDEEVRSIGRRSSAAGRNKTNSPCTDLCFRPQLSLVGCSVCFTLQAWGSSSSHWNVCARR